MKISDIGNVITGNTPSKSNWDYYCSNDIPFIKPDVIDEEIISDKLIAKEYISEKAKSVARIIQKGTVVVTCIGSIGKIGIVNKECAFNQQINAIIPNNNINSYYLALALKANKNRLIQIANAPVVPIINKTQFENFTVNINLDQSFQVDVVKRINGISKLIGKREQQLASLDDLIKSRFVEMFGDPIINPKKWKVTTIGDVVTEVRYGTSKPAVEGGKYPYLRMNNLTYDGHLDLKDLKYIDIPDEEIEKCVVRKGDILFNRTNSIDLVGKTTVFDMSEDMVIAGYIIRVRLKEELLPEILSQYMNLEAIKKILRSMAKGAVNQANINAQELQKINIYIPDIELQKEFIKTQGQINKSKFD